jgi:AcrR family transcriptional regulator
MARMRLTRSESAALTRSELLEAAERRFFSDGYHGTTLEAIAEEAGFSKGAVYSAFDGKADLFLALFDTIIDRRLEAIATLFADHPIGRSRIGALAGRPVEERDQQFFLLTMEFLLHARRDPKLLDQFASHYRRLREGLAELASEASTPLGPDGWAIVTLSLANGLALERLIDPDGVPTDLLAKAQRLLYPPRST